MWFTLDREPPYDVIGGVISPDNPMPGQEITIVWDVKVERACPLSMRSSVQRTVVDSKGVKHDYSKVAAMFDSATTGATITRNVQLPENLAPGPATYSSVACYSCNPMQEYWPVCVHTPEVHFNVAEKAVPMMLVPTVPAIPGLPNSGVPMMVIPP
jgi:hypothetical protein